MAGLHQPALALSAAERQLSLEKGEAELQLPKAHTLDEPLSLLIVVPSSRHLHRTLWPRPMVLA